jgi:hypothetical protein
MVGKLATGHRVAEHSRRVPKMTANRLREPNSIRHWLSCRMLVREQNARETVQLGLGVVMGGDQVEPTCPATTLVGQIVHYHGLNGHKRDSARF